jgi:hypothetical protein
VTKNKSFKQGRELSGFEPKKRSPLFIDCEKIMWYISNIMKTTIIISNIQQIIYNKDSYIHSK